MIYCRVHVVVPGGSGPVASCKHIAVLCYAFFETNLTAVDKLRADLLSLPLSCTSHGVWIT